MQLVLSTPSRFCPSAVSATESTLVFAKNRAKPEPRPRLFISRAHGQNLTPRPNGTIDEGRKEGRKEGKEGSRSEHTATANRRETRLRHFGLTHFEIRITAHSDPSPIRRVDLAIRHTSSYLSPAAAPALAGSGAKQKRTTRDVYLSWRHLSLCCKYAVWYCPSNRVAEISYPRGRSDRCGG